MVVGEPDRLRVAVFLKERLNTVVDLAYKVVERPYEDFKSDKISEIEVS